MLGATDGDTTPSTTSAKHETCRRDGAAQVRLWAWPAKFGLEATRAGAGAGLRSGVSAGASAAAESEIPTRATKAALTIPASPLCTRTLPAWA
jgi:hypothetical protein